MTNSNLTAIGVVLDRSGSMSVCVDDTIGGFNRFLADQKALPGNATLTLCQFDHEYEIVHDGKKLADVPAITKQTYVPRGNTALLDAIGRTIVSMGQRFAAMPEPERPGKVVCVIITDGQENASTEYRLPKIREMIETQRKQFAWEFLFLGAGENAIADAGSMGIPVAAAGHTNTSAVGTQAMYAVADANVAAYRSGAKSSVSLSAADRDALDATS